VNHLGKIVDLPELATRRQIDLMRFSVALLTLGLVYLVICPGWVLQFDSTPKSCVLEAGTAVLLWSFTLSPKLSSAKPGRIMKIVMISLPLQCLLTLAAYLNSTDRLRSPWSAASSLAIIPETAMLCWTAVLCWGFLAVPDAERRFLRIISFCSLVVSGYSICQFLGIDPCVDPGLYTLAGALRPPGTMAHSGNLSGFLVSSLFVTIWVFISEATPAWRRFHFSSIALSIPALLMTGARSGLVALVIGMLTIALFDRRLAKVLASTTAVAVGVLAIVFGFVLNSPLETRFGQYFEDWSGGGRLDLWVDTVHMATFRPWLGFGPDAFASQFPSFVSLRLAMANPDIFRESAHNFLLDRLIASGVCGLLVQFLPLMLLLLALRKQPNRNRHYALLSASITSAVTAHLFFSLTLASAMHLNALVVVGAAALNKSPSPRFFLTLSRPIRFSCAVAGLTCIFVSYQLWTGDALNVAAADAIAEREYTKAEMMLREPRLMRLGIQDVWLSQAFLSSAESSKEPAAQRYALSAARESAILGTRSAADHHNALMNLAMTEWGLEQFDDAERNLRATIVIAPRWFRPRWLLAELLRARQDLEGSRAQASIALQLGGDQFPQIKKALQEIVTKAR
jgi:O-antigen ligase